MELVKPDAAYRDSFLEGLLEFQADGMDDYLSYERVKQDFPGYVKRLIKSGKPFFLPPGQSPYHLYWLVDGSEYVGRLSLRTKNTRDVMSYLGHIGYAIRPGRRGRGCGTEILRLGLINARKMGFPRVLLTCADFNEASRRVIVKNGGVYENSVSDPQGIVRERYWIEL